MQELQAAELVGSYSKAILELATPPMVRACTFLDSVFSNTRIAHLCSLIIKMIDNKSRACTLSLIKDHLLLLYP